MLIEEISIRFISSARFIELSYHKYINNSMFCKAKLPFLLSILWKQQFLEKSEKVRAQKENDNFLLKIVVFFLEEPNDLDADIKISFAKAKLP